MTTKFFESWQDCQFFQDQLASESGIAYAVQVNFADALICQSTDIRSKTSL